VSECKQKQQKENKTRRNQKWDFCCVFASFSFFFFPPSTFSKPHNNTFSHAQLFTFLFTTQKTTHVRNLSLDANSKKYFSFFFLFPTRRRNTKINTQTNRKNSKKYPVRVANDIFFSLFSPFSTRKIDS